MAKPSKVKTYKSFKTAARAAEKLNAVALELGFKGVYDFKVYGKSKLVNGEDVTTLHVATKDSRYRSDFLLYVVNGKTGLIPFRLKLEAHCKFPD
jgi:hypothetical protein